MASLVEKIKFPTFNTDYQEVEWIGSSGTQIIKTNIIPQKLSSISMVVSNCSSYAYWFGVWDVDYNNRAWAMGNDGNNIYVGYGYAGGGQGSTIVDSGKHTIRFIAGKAYIDDNSLVDLSTLSWTDDITNYLCLFGQNRAGTLYPYGSFRLHSCTIDGIEFVPVYRRSDGVIGLFDTTNGTFYDNDGTGTFTKGADVSTIRYRTPNYINYGSNGVYLIDYNGQCLFQRYANIRVSYSKEISLKQYLSSWSANSIAYPITNGCHILSRSGSTETSTISLNAGFRETIRLNFVAYSGADTSSTSWNISSITAPSIDGGTNTSLNIKNNNSFVVTCYYGTSSGSTTYSTSISANSTSTISGLTSGTTYYFFFRANRTGTITYNKRLLSFDGSNYAQSITTDVYINDLKRKDVSVSGATITSTESTSGTISSSVTSGVPSSASWHTMWTGSVTKVAISKSTISDTLSGFSGLIVGLPVRFTCKFGNSSTITCVVSSQSLPSTITSSQFSTTVTISELSVSDSSTISWTRKASATNTRTLYITKMEQYY